MALAAPADRPADRTTGAVVDGLWHCLLGGLVAGLAVSTLLGVVVLILSRIG